MIILICSVLGIVVAGFVFRVQSAGSKDERRTYHCPFGNTTINADSAESLAIKVRNHNWYAHGTAPIVICQK
jgi:hypothetical protein